MMGWWSFGTVCKKHKREATLQSFEFSADGELRLTFYCYECKDFFVTCIYASTLEEDAREKDRGLREGQQNKLAKPVRPPLQITPPAFTEEDMKFLAELKIKDEKK
jgi:hypothetical protein